MLLDEALARAYELLFALSPEHSLAHVMISMSNPKKASVINKTP